MSILLCIPAFNEEKVIGDVIRKSFKFVDHVVVYDDGSTDKTSLVAQEAGAYTIRNMENKGKGYALKELFRYARHSESGVIVTMDGDGQFKPEEIPKLYKPITEQNQDVVIGSRFENNEEMPKYRELGNKMLDRLSSMTSKLQIKDTQSGFRAYSKHAVDVIKFSSDGFGSDAEILINAYDNGLKITEVPISVIYKTGYDTSTKNPVSHTSGVVATLIELVLIKHPLKYLGIPGFVLIILGIITSVYVLTVFNETRYFSIGFSLIGISLFIFGLMLILVSGLLYAFDRQLRNR